MSEHKVTLQLEVERAEIIANAIQARSSELMKTIRDDHDMNATRLAVAELRVIGEIYSDIHNQLELIREIICEPQP